MVCDWLAPTTDAQKQRLLNEEFRLHRNFHSKFLPKDHDIIVRLPPGYDSAATKRYPVLYMHDGSSVMILLRLMK